MRVRRPLIPSVVVLVAAALVSLLVYGVVHGGDNRSLDDAVKQGRKPAAPGLNIKLPLLQGSGERSLADYSGKVVVLNFWASWCTPCRAEAPVLEHAQATLNAHHSGTVLGATYDDTPKDSLAFLSAHQVQYPSLKDIGTKLAAKYGTNRLPETFVLDGKGRVIAISRGQIRQAFLDDAIKRAEAS